MKFAVSVFAILVLVTIATTAFAAETISKTSPSFTAGVGPATYVTRGNATVPPMIRLASAQTPALAPIVIPPAHGPDEVMAPAAETSTPMEATVVPEAESTSGVSTSASSSAGSGSSTITIPEALKNKKFEENSEITDAKIRADAGSLSKYSAKFSLSYYGPTMNDVSQKMQPNPDNSNAPKETAISGSISTRYRLDPQSTISFGTGVKAVSPGYATNRYDINDPYVSYDVTTKIGKHLQMRNSPGFSYITTPNYRNTGEDSAVKFDQSLAYQIEDTNFFATFDTSLGYYFYNRGYVPGAIKKGGDGAASRYTAAVYPGFKYRYNDTISFATSLAISEWNPRSVDSSTVLWRTSATQRLALGWAITHDIYVSPYLDIYPQALAFDTTTMNIATVFSIL
jgi:hypothetical protein